VNDRTWLSADDCSLSDLVAVTNVTTSLDDYPWAAQVIDDVLIWPIPTAAGCCRTSWSRP
jgi:hypothetical protein